MLLAAAATLAVVVTGAGAAPSDLPPTPWKMEPWYDAVNSELWLVSTGAPGGVAKCTWKGAAYVLNSNTNDFKLWGCARPSYIWAKTCTKAAQTVSFTKRIFVPGAPKVFEVSLGSYKNKPLKELDLLVNGGTALRATHAVHKVDLKGRAGLFKFGWNVLTVTAKKPATKEKCDQPEYAVAFEIHAAFRADLVAKSPEPAKSDSAVLIDEVTITNKGPSTTLFGTVSFSAGTRHLKLIVDKYIILSKSPIGGPFDDHCMYYSSSTYCPMPGLRPGESFHFYAHYIYDAPPAPTPFYEEFETQWGAAADTIDPDPASSGGKRNRGVCRQSAPPPCKKPA
jgi:hypothetical protein